MGMDDHKVMENNRLGRAASKNRRLNEVTVARAREYPFFTVDLTAF
jgi:hypothetical protein